MTDGFIWQISMVRESCRFALKELKRWMKPEKVQIHIYVDIYDRQILEINLLKSPFATTTQVATSVTTFPSSAKVVSEPLGVVLIISAWNYPFCKWRIILY